MWRWMQEVRMLKEALVSMALRVEGSRMDQQSKMSRRGFGCTANKAPAIFERHPGTAKP